MTESATVPSSSVQNAQGSTWTKTTRMLVGVGAVVQVVWVGALALGLYELASLVLRSLGRHLG